MRASSFVLGSVLTMAMAGGAVATLPADPAAEFAPPSGGGATGSAAWSLVDSTRLAGAAGLDRYSRFYAFNQDRAPYYTPDAPQPEGALQLNSSAVNDCYVETAGDIPHGVRWVLEVNVTSNKVTLTPEADGIVFQINRRSLGFAVTQGWHSVEIERLANRVTVRLDGVGEAVTFVSPAARVPLRVTARYFPLVWIRKSSLYAAGGETWGANASGVSAVARRHIDWVEVYRQSFDTPGSLKDFVQAGTNGLVEWEPEDGCVRLRRGPGKGGDETVLMLNKSLPGDIRVGFRARNIPPEDQFFAVYLSCKDDVRREDGYFCEWNRGWMRRIKKMDVQRALVRPGERTRTERHWQNYCAERVGDTVRMFCDGKEDLAWTDPDPVIEPECCRLAFYIWRVPVEIDDLVVERNAADLEREAAAGHLAPPAAVGTKSLARPRAAGAADTVIVRQTAAEGLQAQSLSAPALRDLAMQSDTISFRWEAAPNCEYTVETCNSLGGNSTWTPVPGWTARRATEGWMTFSASTSTNGHSFYRVIARRAL